MTTSSDAIISGTKNFFSIFFCILESRFNFEHVKEKDDPQGSCIFDLTDSEKHG